MRQLDSDLWVSEIPLRFLGVEVGARMTVIRLADGGLLLHSPVTASPELVRDVEALGEVRFLVAPNRLHHLFMAEWQSRYPGALTFMAPGLETKRPDLRADAIFGDESRPEWKDAVEHVFMEGFPFANEVVFFHKPSNTLIATDIAFNLGDESPWLTRAFIRLTGSYGKLAPTLVERMLIRDPAAFGRSLERVLAWPFERVVVAHGQVSETGGREELEAGYAWILDRPS